MNHLPPGLGMYDYGLSRQQAAGKTEQQVSGLWAKGPGCSKNLSVAQDMLEIVQVVAVLCV